MQCFCSTLFWIDWRKVVLWVNFINLMYVILVLPKANRIRRYWITCWKRRATTNVYCLPLMVSTRKDTLSETPLLLFGCCCSGCAVRFVYSNVCGTIQRLFLCLFSVVESIASDAVLWLLQQTKLTRMSTSNRTHTHNIMHNMTSVRWFDYFWGGVRCGWLVGGLWIVTANFLNSIFTSQNRISCINVCEFVCVCLRFFCVLCFFMLCVDIVAWCLFFAFAKQLDQPQIPSLLTNTKETAPTNSNNHLANVCPTSSWWRSSVRTTTATTKTHHKKQTTNRTLLTPVCVFCRRGLLLWHGYSR